MEAIPTLMKLEIGIFKDMNDSRALSNYEVAFQMNFANEAAYKAYQSHPLHIALKEKIGVYLDGQPATYDFILK